MRKSHDVNRRSFSPDITNEKRAKLIEKFGKDVEAWEALKREGVHEHTIKKTLGFSRSTYFRRKRALSALIRGAEISRADRSIFAPGVEESLSLS
ncbi:MAG: hypothetical protein LBJ96_05780 [Holosporaceae bacterium]|jgi:hypothetical protein|nr:hypothetical protein [Holosporaceae bacterium]